MTADELASLREEATRLGLHGRETLLATPDKDVMAIANGIGASWMPERLRKALDALHPSLVLPSVIHDLQYYFGAGTWYDFQRANRDFEANGVLVSRTFEWWDPRRWWIAHKARQYRAILDALGWIAYLQAVRDRQTGALTSPPDGL